MKASVEKAAELREGSMRKMIVLALVLVAGAVAVVAAGGVGGAGKPVVVASCNTNDC